MRHLVASLVALAGCAGSRPAPQPAVAAPPTEAAAPPAPAAAPVHVPTSSPFHDRLRDPAGDVPGLTGYSLARAPAADHCGGVAIVTTRAKQVGADEAPLAAVYDLEFPTGLDFDPDPAKQQAKQASLARSQAFVAELQKVGRAAIDHYQAQLTSADPAVKTAAMARMAQVSFRIASLLGRAEIPLTVRSGEFAADKIAAFCDALAEQAEPLQARGEDGARVCAELAKQAGTGWWDRVCTTAVP